MWRDPTARVVARRGARRGAPARVAASRWRPTCTPPVRGPPQGRGGSSETGRRPTAVPSRRIVMQSGRGRRSTGPWDNRAVNADELRRLLSRGPLLSDGGMGTSLIDRGAAVDSCFEALNVSAPALVESVHR